MMVETELTRGLKLTPALGLVTSGKQKGRSDRVQEAPQPPQGISPSTAFFITCAVNPSFLFFFSYIHTYIYFQCNLRPASLLQLIMATETDHMPFLGVSCYYVPFSSFLFFHVFSSADWSTQILQFFLVSLFQDFCFPLYTLQSDHTFLYKCHPKHAFSTDKEKAIPVSRRDTAGASE